MDEDHEAIEAMMRTRAVRGILVIVLASLVFWLVVLQRRPEVQSAGASGLAAGEEFAESPRLVFRSATDSIVVERRGGEYWVTYPIRDRASDTRILQSIQAARTLASERDLPDTDGRAFGLDPPLRTFSLESETGARWTIALGDSSPVTSLIYARVAGAPNIFLLRSFSARRDFIPELEGLRDPFVLPLSSPVVDSVEIVTRENRLRAYRMSKEEWIAKDPAGVLLDPLPINRALRHLRTPVIREYVTEPEAPRQGLDPPRARWVVFHAGKADTVLIGNLADPRGEGVYCVPPGRGVRAVMASDFFRDFVDGWPALAQRKLISIPAESLRSVAAEGGPAYRLGAKGWTAAEDTTLVRAPEIFQREMQNLCVLQWVRYPETELVPRAEPGPVLRLASGARAETLWLAPGPSDTTWLARSTRLRRWGEVSTPSARTWLHRFGAR